MRRMLLLTTCLALAACSAAPDRRERESQGEAADAQAIEAPGIAVTAAPGVAFVYNYGFRLPAPRIAATQEAHARACEKLGVARCRITGMRYQLLGENDIAASLVFKLDPTIARAFGKQGIDVVNAAQGTLVDAEITGSDAGAAITRLSTDRARADEERRRIEAALATAKTAAERAELQAQLAEIARRVAAVDDNVADQRESLATTPMTFDYRSGPAIRGFDASAPIKSAADTALASIQYTLAVALGALALLGPPALLILLLWWLWRRFAPALRQRAVGGTAPAPD